MALDKKMLIRIGVGTAAAVVLCCSVVTCSNHSKRLDRVEQMGIENQEAIQNVIETTKEVVKTTDKLSDKVLEIRDELLDSLAVTNGKLNKLDSLQRAQKPCLCNQKKDNAKPEKPAKPVQPAKPVKSQPAKPAKPVQPAQPVKPVVVVAAPDSVAVPSNGTVVTNSGTAQSEISGNTEVHFENGGTNNGTVIINNGGVINQTNINQQNVAKEKDPWAPATFVKTSVREYVYHRNRCK